jgi:hypothetical protein
MALTSEEIRMLRLPPQMIPFVGDPANPPTAGVTIAMPKLDSPFVQTDDLTTSIPWYLLVINLWRLAQPTGVTPGVYLGFTVNAYGQITDVQTSGITITSPIVTNPTINGGTINNVTINGSTLNNPTINNQTSSGGTFNNPTLNNALINAVTITGANSAPTQAAANNTASIATTAYVKSQGYITDAPIDGNRYCRQNGAWVAF